MAQSRQYVDAAGVAVNWSTAVVSGVAQVDIYEVITEDQHSNRYTFAKAGQPVDPGKLAAAQYADVAAAANRALTGTLTQALEVARPDSTAVRYLPAGAAAGAVRGLQNAGTEPIRVTPTGTDTIDGGTAAVDVKPGEVSRFQSNGAGAWVHVNDLSTTYASGVIAKPGDDLAGKLATAAVTSTDLLLTPGIYVLTAGLTWDSAKHSIRGLGHVVLDFTGLTSGYALTVIGVDTKGNTYDIRPITHKLTGVEIVGPDGDATTADGIKVEDTANGSHICFENLKVFGFRDQVYLGVNTWSLSFINVALGHAHRYCVNVDATTNAGESYRFVNCTFYSSKNASDSGTAIYTSSTGNADSHFYGCSFDYNNIEIDHNSGTVSLHGCHLENNSTTQPMVLLSRTGGQARTLLTMHGTSIGPTEASASSRDHLIQVKAASSNGVRVFAGGCQWGTFDKNVTVFKNLSAASNAIFRHEGGDIDNSGGGTRAASMGQATNLLSNGDFESSTGYTAGALVPGGWAHGGTVTYTIDATNPRSGTRSQKMVGPNGNAVSTVVSQIFPVRTGSELVITIWVNITSLLAGTIQPRYAFYLGDLTTRQSITNFGTLMSAATSGWVPHSVRVQVPPGVSYGYIDLQVSNFEGTAFLDDCVVTAL